MNNGNKIMIANLLYALLFLVFGIIILTSTDDLITLTSKIIGSILVVFGMVKAIIYIYMKGKVGEYSTFKLITGLFIIGLGVLLILCSETLSIVIRIIVGTWIIFAGVNRLIFAICVKSVDKNGFIMFFISSLVMMIVGVLLITGLFDKLLGLFIIIYSIAEIIDYIYYKSSDKDYTPIEKQKDDNTKLKMIKGKKTIDAVIEEENRD